MITERETLKEVSEYDDKAVVPNKLQKKST